MPIIPQTAPVLISFQSITLPRTASATSPRRKRPAPAIKLKSIGQPNVNSVTEAFRPLLERLLERMNKDGSVIQLVPAPPLPTFH